MWFFTPKNDLCIDCNRLIDIHHERHYIVWDDVEAVYRRECATCHDALSHQAYERSHSSQPMVRRLSNEGDSPCQHLRIDDDTCNSCGTKFDVLGRVVSDSTGKGKHGD